MTGDQLLAILPIIMIAAVAVVVMLAISIRRDYKLTVGISLAGLLLCILVLPIANELSPSQVTPLLVIDQYAVFFMALLFGSGIAVTALCYGYFQYRDGENEELYLLILTAVMGGAVLVASSHFATFFIGLETLSVSLFAMIAYPVKDKLALEAAVKYLILSGVSSAFLLFGMALVYAEIGTLVFTDIGSQLAVAEPNLAALIGFMMLVAAMGFKLSLVPFHMWTSDVYQGAPAPVTAFVATVSKSAIFALLLRYFITSSAYAYNSVLVGLSIMAVASILVGNLLALLQANVKRILAYSSIAHLGYVLIAFIAGSTIGTGLTVEAVTFYLVAYSITTLGAFGVVTVLSTGEQDADRMEDYQGLYWSRPGLATILTAMLLSLAGIPLTVGFVGKFYIFAAGVDGALWLLLFALVAGSGIGLYYYLRIILQMIKSPAESESPESGEAATTPLIGGLTLTVLTVMLLWFGVLPGSLTDLIRNMAETLS